MVECELGVSPFAKAGEFVPRLGILYLSWARALNHHDTGFLAFPFFLFYLRASPSLLYTRILMFHSIFIHFMARKCKFTWSSCLPTILVGMVTVAPGSASPRCFSAAVPPVRRCSGIGIGLPESIKNVYLINSGSPVLLHLSPIHYILANLKSFLGSIY